MPGFSRCGGGSSPSFSNHAKQSGHPFPPFDIMIVHALAFSSDLTTLFILSTVLSSSSNIFGGSLTSLSPITESSHILTRSLLYFPVSSCCPCCSSLLSCLELSFVADCSLLVLSISFTLSVSCLLVCCILLISFVIAANAEPVISSPCLFVFVVISALGPLLFLPSPYVLILSCVATSLSLKFS